MKESPDENQPAAEKLDTSSSQQKADSLTSAYVDELAASRTALAEHTHILSTVLNSLGDGVLVWDREERTLLANRAMFEMTGREFANMPRRELLARYDFYQIDGITPLPLDELPYEDAVRHKRPFSKEGLVRGALLPPEGKWMRVMASPILDESGELLGVVSVVQDITERKQLEHQRNALATLITHDLKNHLAGWDVLLGMLGPDFQQRLSADELDVIEQLRQGNQQFLELSNTLLELYRSDLYALKSRRVHTNLEQLIRSSVTMNEHYASALGVRLTISVEGSLPALTCIPPALRQGLHNLVQNAIDAATSKGAVRVMARTEGNSVVVEVQDDGAGMSAMQIHELFNQDHVASSISKTTKSTGFGLYLTRLLIESQGGRISCSSELGKGTTFTVELPID